MKNQIVLGKVENKQIAFDFGDGQMLRLTPEEKKQRLTGWWTQGRSPFHPNSFLTPVELRAETKNRFSGEISPLEERITFYMPVTVGADKKATTYLCNPEQNAGRLLDVRRIDLVDGEVRLLGFPFGSEKEETVGRGVADLDNDTLTVYVARVGQGYEFQRVRPDQASGFYPRDRPGVNPPMRPRQNARTAGRSRTSMTSGSRGKRSSALFNCLSTHRSLACTHRKSTLSSLPARGISLGGILPRLRSPYLA